jgi:hypothetical protein
VTDAPAVPGQRPFEGDAADRGHPTEAAAQEPEALHELIVREDWKRHIVGERRGAEAPGTPERRA